MLDWDGECDEDTGSSGMENVGMEAAFGVVGDSGSSIVGGGGDVAIIGGGGGVMAALAASCALVLFIVLFVSSCFFATPFWAVVLVFAPPLLCVGVFVMLRNQVHGST